MRTRINELRAARDLTQLQLAQMGQVRRESIVFLERGINNPSLQLTSKIARVLDEGRRYPDK